MKAIALALLAASLTSCTSDEVNTWGRTLSAASHEYYNRPGYYPQPVVHPVAPVYAPVY